MTARARSRAPPADCTECCPAARAFTKVVRTVVRRLKSTGFSLRQSVEDTRLASARRVAVQPATAAFPRHHSLADAARSPFREHTTCRAEILQNGSEVLVQERELLVDELQLADLAGGRAAGLI